MPVNLASYSSAHFDRGATKATEVTWILTSLILFRLCPFSLSPLKRAVLRLFGARIGRGVVIKPQVKITFPWKLSVGDHVWVGEECWLMNLERIEIGDHVCISQKAQLCTGSHDYTLPTFDLIVKPVKVETGAWIGAAAWVGPGVTIGTHAVLSAGSVATKPLEPWGIFRGNPAVLVRQRVITDGKASGH
jgi:putative colanic acid biosynthesis acetyltransferase WcaF